MRAEWAASGAATPSRDYPTMEFAYGVVHGRDAACQHFRDKIEAVIADEDDKEKE